MAKKETKEVHDVKELIQQDEPSMEVGFPIDFSEDAGLGLEDLTAADMSLPFIMILQKGSPQVDESLRSAKFLPGARAGMFINTLTNDLTPGDTGLLVIPCGYRKVAVEWKPRDTGGGLVGHHAIDSEIVTSARRNDKNQLVLPGGNILVETAYHFILVEDEAHGELPTPAVIAMSSTQLKKSRKWNTIMDGIRLRGPNGQVFKAPTFAYHYRITSVPESNAQGSWWGFLISTEGQINDKSAYNMAKEFYQAVRRNEVKVSAPPVDDVPTGDDEHSNF